ncbi:hypothetical protein CCACVL1_25982 [Corchorus capsularis]|uniref:VLRF1 domain-containing protein n=1 Tax=Corchorus capsularis TaxID=210143 RepID=A0A1R3GGC7_COCAP|nr:hypothetical protein CCACVL1_25982 [Corchorus capsularis]
MAPAGVRTEENLQLASKFQSFYLQVSKSAKEDTELICNKNSRREERTKSCEKEEEKPKNLFIFHTSEIKSRNSSPEQKLNDTISMPYKYRSLAYAATSCQVKRQRSIFHLPPDFFDSCRLLPPSFQSLSISESDNDSLEIHSDSGKENSSRSGVAVPRLTCNTCKAKFDSLQDQRSHFKSEIHRFNVKLKIAGKDIVKEEDFDELTADSFKDYEAGSEDGADEVAAPRNDAHKSSIGNIRQKLFIRLKTGERVSIWKSLILNASESVSYGKNNYKQVGNLREIEVIERLKASIQEDRDNLRIVLLSTGGHFAGCVFDGDSVVAQKTFHRYVVGAKAGKKQSSKDGTGKAAHSAGAALRQYNERALNKEVQELLAAWKPYFDASSCVFIHAPSSNRRMLFDGDLVSVTGSVLLEMFH